MIESTEELHDFVNLHRSTEHMISFPSRSASGEFEFCLIVRVRAGGERERGGEGGERERGEGGRGGGREREGGRE